MEQKISLAALLRNFAGAKRHLILFFFTLALLANCTDRIASAPDDCVCWLLPWTFYFICKHCSLSLKLIIFTDMQLDIYVLKSVISLYFSHFHGRFKICKQPISIHTQAPHSFVCHSKKCNNLIKPSNAFSSTPKLTMKPSSLLSFLLICC